MWHVFYDDFFFQDDCFDKWQPQKGAYNKSIYRAVSCQKEFYTRNGGDIIHNRRLDCHNTIQSIKWFISDCVSAWSRFCFFFFISPFSYNCSTQWATMLKASDKNANTLPPHIMWIVCALNTHWISIFSPNRILNRIESFDWLQIYCIRLKLCTLREIDENSWVICQCICINLIWWINVHSIIFFSSFVCKW